MTCTAVPLRVAPFGLSPALFVTCLSLGMAGCPGDVTDTGSTPIPSTTANSGWCAVTTLFNTYCVICHNSTFPQGALDLETDPFAALVGVNSSASGVPLVTPGDPENSLLVRKIEGTLADTEGSAMPPTGLLATDEQQIIRAWVEDGASSSCDATPTGTVPQQYHPEGWSEPTAHGMAAKMQDDNCQSCHGDDLAGGSTGVACATCHNVDGIVDWTTTCTYCHGDPSRTTADAPAPPQDIDDTDDIALISFPEHRAHLLQGEGDHPTWDCTQCHLLPTDVFTAGHLFDGDDTPGAAEVVFTAGLFSGGVYNGGASTCSGGYCHSSGVDGAWVPRTVTIGATLSCTGCHAGKSNPDDLSGQHKKHTEEGITCDECHATVGPTGTEVDEPDLHVNATVDVDLPAGMNRNNAAHTCSGTCHGEPHQNNPWFD